MADAASRVGHDIGDGEVASERLFRSGGAQQLVHEEFIHGGYVGFGRTRTVALLGREA